ncbi:hypothetical protein OCF84_20720 (plasmid) [Shewanella xiamenensis]|uniref:Uncharacterized protein n=1 Tax=Shewanella xiamenensis TaxID=332186 RepID=A0ABT6UFR2_9GAMM|nr:hypothetical protein [Shewanella xiamenensis]MDI5833308.1 hypothetical protein [Shewanella xiamenensis]WHF57942.1 hypothetical protein OCF84_20720 [Shewanella xiamenensis]
MPKYPYNPIEVLNSLKGHADVNTAASKTNNLVHRHNNNVSRITDLNLESLRYLDKISKIKYVNLLTEAKANYLNDSPKDDPRYPSFVWYFRENIAFDTAPPFSLKYSKPHQKHRFAYDLARFSRSHNIDPESIIRLTTAEKRDALIDGLCYVAMAINSTIELHYFVNCVEFYASNFGSNPEIISNVNESLRNRLRIIGSADSLNYLSFKKIIANNPKYMDDSCVMPIYDSINPYGIRELILRQFSFDLKNNHYVSPEIAQQYIKKLNIFKQSYFRLPVDLLASTCSESEIISYYDQLEPPFDYGMNYLLDKEGSKTLTLDRREQMLSNVSNKLSI